MSANGNALIMNDGNERDMPADQQCQQKGDDNIKTASNGEAKPSVKNGEENDLNDIGGDRKPRASQIRREDCGREVSVVITAV